MKLPAQIMQEWLQGVFRPGLVETKSTQKMRIISALARGEKLSSREMQLGLKMSNATWRISNVREWLLPHGVFLKTERCEMKEHGMRPVRYYKYFLSKEDCVKVSAVLKKAK